MPRYLRVTVVALDPPEHRVTFVLRQRHPVVCAPGETLSELTRRVHMSSGGGVEEDNRSRAEASRVLVVDDGGPREHSAVLVRKHRVFKLSPMDEIVTDRVAPGHVAPDSRLRVVLEVENSTPRPSRRGRSDR